MRAVTEGKFSVGLPYLRLGQGPPLVVASPLTSAHASPTGGPRGTSLASAAPFAEHFTVYLVNRRPLRVTRVARNQRESATKASPRTTSTAFPRASSNLRPSLADGATKLAHRGGQGRRPQYHEERQAEHTRVRSLSRPGAPSMRLTGHAAPPRSIDDNPVFDRRRVTSIQTAPTVACLGRAWSFWEVCRAGSRAI